MSPIHDKNLFIHIQFNTTDTPIESFVLRITRNWVLASETVVYTTFTEGGQPGLVNFNLF